MHSDYSGSRAPPSGSTRGNTPGLTFAQQLYASAAPTPTTHPKSSHSPTAPAHFDRRSVASGNTDTPASLYRRRSVSPQIPSQLYLASLNPDTQDADEPRIVSPSEFYHTSIRQSGRPPIASNTALHYTPQTPVSPFTTPPSNPGVTYRIAAPHRQSAHHHNTSPTSEHALVPTTTASRRRSSPTLPSRQQRTYPSPPQTSTGRSFNFTESPPYTPLHAPSAYPAQASPPSSRPLPPHPHRPSPPPSRSPPSPAYRGTAASRTPPSNSVICQDVPVNDEDGRLSALSHSLHNFSLGTGNDPSASASAGGGGAFDPPPPEPANLATAPPLAATGGHASDLSQYDYDFLTGDEYSEDPYSPSQCPLPEYEEGGYLSYTGPEDVDYEEQAIGGGDGWFPQEEEQPGPQRPNLAHQTQYVPDTPSSTSYGGTMSHARRTPDPLPPRMSYGGGGSQMPVTSYAGTTTGTSYSGSRSATPASVYPQRPASRSSHQHQHQQTPQSHRASQMSLPPSGPPGPPGGFHTFTVPGRVSVTAARVVGSGSGSGSGSGLGSVLGSGSGYHPDPLLPPAHKPIQAFTVARAPLGLGQRAPMGLGLSPGPGPGPAVGVHPNSNPNPILRPPVAVAPPSVLQQNYNQVQAVPAQARPPYGYGYGQAQAQGVQAHGQGQAAYGGYNAMSPPLAPPPPPLPPMPPRPPGGPHQTQYNYNQVLVTPPASASSGSSGSSSIGMNSPAMPMGAPAPSQALVMPAQSQPGYPIVAASMNGGIAGVPGHGAMGGYQPVLMPGNVSASAVGVPQAAVVPAPPAPPSGPSPGPGKDQDTGVNAQKIVQYAQTAASIAGVAVKIFQAAETLTGDNNTGSNNVFF